MPIFPRVRYSFLITVHVCSLVQGLNFIHWRKSAKKRKSVIKEKIREKTENPQKPTENRTKIKKFVLRLEKEMFALRFCSATLSSSFGMTISWFDVQSPIIFNQTPNQMAKWNEKLTHKYQIISKRFELISNFRTFDDTFNGTFNVEVSLIIKLE